MTWFKVDDSFSSHPKVMAIPRGAARLRAIGLWTSLGTWCARQLTDGRFARHMVDEHGGTVADARRLVEVGLWVTTKDGYAFHDWEDWQPTRAKVEDDRAAARERMRRNRSAGSAGVRPNSDRTSEVVTPTPTRPDPTNAAAAASDVPSPPLPPSLTILRAALEARKLMVRWDRLSADDAAEIEALVAEHGDGALVASALRAFQPNKPAAFAQAWLPGWRDLRSPGDLRVVHAPCDQPGHSGTVKHCAQCASEQKAAR